MNTRQHTPADRLGNSSRPPLEPLRDLIAAADLEQLAGHYCGPPTRQTGGTLTYRCPRGHEHPAGTDRHPSLTITAGRDGRGRWCCWSHPTAARGDALDLVQWCEQLDRTPAIARLRQLTGRPLSTTGPTSTPTRATPPAPKPEPRSFHPAGDIGTPVPEPAASEHLARYLAGRHWPHHLADRHGLQIVHRAGRIWCRHPFYVPDQTGPLRWSYQDRALPLELDQRPKWYAPPGQPLPLYGLEHLEDTNAPAVVLVEGPADTITGRYALEAYPDCAVAVLGIPGAHGWSPKWLPMLAGRLIIIATDPDPAGLALSAQLRADLEGHASEVRTVSPDWLLGDLTTTAAADIGSGPGSGLHLVAAALLEPLHNLTGQDTPQ